MAHVKPGSDLIRRKWTVDNLLKKKSESFFSPFTGKSNNSVIYQVNDGTCKDGHTVIFDFSAFLTGKGVKGDGEACIVGEEKRKFSGSLMVEMFSWYVNNGTKFAACDIGDINLAQHSDSISLLGDLYIRHIDQARFDNIQGATGSKPTHVFNLGKGFSWDKLLEIENAAKRGAGLFKTSANGALTNIKAEKRIPLKPWKMKNQRPLYLAIIDNAMATALKQDEKYQNIKMHADVRGESNAVINGLLGVESNVLYVEAPVFIGNTAPGKFGIIEDTEIEFSGLRRYATGPGDEVVWEGQFKFEAMEALADEEKAEIAAENDPVIVAELEAKRQYRIYSRGAILGASALREAFGQMPRYDAEWTDFKKSSKSMLEIIYQVAKTILTVEKGTDYKGKIANIDYSVIALDMEV